MKVSPNYVEFHTRHSENIMQIGAFNNHENVYEEYKTSMEREQ